MRIGATQHVYTVGLIFLSLLMLFEGASPQLQPLIYFTFLGGCGYAWRGWQARPIVVHPFIIIFLIGVWVFFALDLADLLIGSLIILTVYRLYNLGDSQAYQQLYILSFAHVILSAYLSFELKYGLMLVAYMLCVSVGLVLNHLRRELEKGVLVTHSNQMQEEGDLGKLLNSRRFLSHRFMILLNGMAFVLCLGALVLFFVFPRVGGQWLEGIRRVENRAGFSGEVNLGQIGEIQNYA